MKKGLNCATLFRCPFDEWMGAKVYFIPSYLKGALDKYNIFLFIPNSIEDLKLSQYQNFQQILPMRFNFMRYFVNSIVFRVSHRLLYCVFY